MPATAGKFLNDFRDAGPPRAEATAGKSQKIGLHVWEAALPHAETAAGRIPRQTLLHKGQVGWPVLKRPGKTKHDKLPRLPRRSENTY
jgi:hypothetical protein